MNLLSYFLNAVNVLRSDHPRRKRGDTLRAASAAWAWARENPTPATAVLAVAALALLFALLAWGPL